MHSTILKRVALLMEKWRSVRLSCSSLLLAGFVCATILSVASFAQAPLNFGNNFFVTGDYFVAGAYGINTNFTTINGASYTTGVISVPDPNPGITGETASQGRTDCGCVAVLANDRKGGSCARRHGIGPKWVFQTAVVFHDWGPGGAGLRVFGNERQPQ